MKIAAKSRPSSSQLRQRGGGFLSLKTA